LSTGTQRGCTTPSVGVDGDMGRMVASKGIQFSSSQLVALTEAPLSLSSNDAESTVIVSADIAAEAASNVDVTVGNICWQ
jgi:hypothetical protein